MRPHTSIRNAKKRLNSEHGPIVQEQNEIYKARPQYLNLSTESLLSDLFNKRCLNFTQKKTEEMLKCVQRDEVL